MTRSTRARKRVDSTAVQSAKGAGMAKVIVRIPNVSWRDGRPRFNPGPKLRKLGYKGEDLRHPTGAWFTVPEAADWAQARADEVAGRRKARAETGRLPARRRERHQTIQGLADEWFESPKFKGGTVKGKRVEPGLSEVTAADYKGKLASLWKYDPELGQEPPPAITPQLAQAIFDRMWEERGLAAARSAVAVLSSMWKWAKARGRGGIMLNPWIGLEKPMLAPRLVVWEDHEVAALVAAADAWARPEIGDSVYFGLFTGQRQNDRLAYERAGTDDEGRLVFRQSKTNAIVAIPATPHLAARLDAAERRRFALPIAGRPDKGEAQAVADARARRLVIVDETAGRPFLRDWYKHVFMRVREVAARGLVHNSDGTVELGPEKPTGSERWRLPPCPSVATKRDQDLRDTAVTWLARAGCNELQIAAITGHSLASIHNVLKHYLALHPEMADAAIGKMLAWMESRGSVL
ncbi:Uncharacterised protein [Starkeya nomas]|uniref:Tyr recombinase domain-containing protein n=1 Tax=Starkeya nomas TaxID=2666134 RepID=A0A5S9NYN5_9HYPH|nr:hypothetical protein [Starkeya nomas]CAA0096005.1 Uncharacterised protein [Starkeya nomas]